MPVDNGGVSLTCAASVSTPKPVFRQAQLGGHGIWVVPELVLEQLQGLVAVTDTLLEPGHHLHQSVAGGMLSVGLPVQLQGFGPSLCQFVLESCSGEVVHAVRPS